MAPKISEEKLLAAATTTITVITNTSNVRVELDSFFSNESFTSVTCRAVLHEGKHGRALELLNASITDKAFASNMSSVLGVSLNMTVAYWMYSPDNTTISTPYPGADMASSNGSSAGNNDEGGESTGSGDNRKIWNMNRDLFLGKSVGLIMFHINSLK